MAALREVFGRAEGGTERVWRPLVVTHFSCTSRGGIEGDADCRKPQAGPLPFAATLPAAQTVCVERPLAAQQQ